MKGFSLIERTKLAIAFKSCNAEQWKDLKAIFNKEDIKRSKKNAIARKSKKLL